MATLTLPPSLSLSSAGRENHENATFWTVVVLFVAACFVCVFPLFLCVKGCVTSIGAALCDKVCKCPPDYA